MRDHVTALLRTAVPALWGAFVAWLLSLAAYPEFLSPITEALASDGAQVAVVAAVIAAWYEVARLLEPRIPAWATRILLGSSASPTYLRGEPTAK
jgi:hypothetical protein